jgi:hypothetical protein
MTPGSSLTLKKILVTTDLLNLLNIKNVMTNCTRKTRIVLWNFNTALIKWATWLEWLKEDQIILIFTSKVNGLEIHKQQVILELKLII